MSSFGATSRLHVIVHIEECRFRGARSSDFSRESGNPNFYRKLLLFKIPSVVFKNICDSVLTNRPILATLESFFSPGFLLLLPSCQESIVTITFISHLQFRALFSYPMRLGQPLLYVSIDSDFLLQNSSLISSQKYIIMYKENHLLLLQLTLPRTNQTTSSLPLSRSPV